MPGEHYKPKTGNASSVPAIYLGARIILFPHCSAARPLRFPKKYGTARQGKENARQSKERQAREQGGGGWAQLLLIVKRRIKKGEEKARWAVRVVGTAGGRGQRKRREK